MSRIIVPPFADTEERLRGDFLLRACLPLFYQYSDGTVRLRATGTLFEIADQFFIVTAGHVFDRMESDHEEIDSARFAVPESHVLATVHNIGSYIKVRPKQQHYDVALFQLTSPETIAKLKAGWECLTLAQIAKPLAGEYVTVAGCPIRESDHSSYFVRGKFFKITSNLLPQAPTNLERPADPNELFIAYAGEAQLPNGKTTKTPDLTGVSGASIWQHREPGPGEVWSGRANYRCVGVQHAVSPSYIWAWHWNVVAECLRLISPELEAAVLRAL